ncbi:MarR family transcriptional regulator [Hydrogenophaga sp. 5NK40-0174]|uniref:MarR family winged helix-turn-helix transcriptional regulator n=1 Tax=Hydrogenophaga sp. 5NK40-0174 TaxID=3127649 RepID=UPI003108F355
MPKPAPSAKAPVAIDINDIPGHLIRRLHQISVGIFLAEAAETGLTPVQFGVLQVVCNQPGIDQRTLARAIALDASTTGGVVDRMASRGWLKRATSREDRRARVLTLTAEGEVLLASVVPAMQKAQHQILAPLTPRQQKDFVHLLNKLVTSNNDMSRAPTGATGSTEGL